MRAADVVHFNFGEPLFPVPQGVGGRHRGYRTRSRPPRPPVLRRLGKRVVVTFQGDDARQAVVGGGSSPPCRSATP